MPLLDIDISPLRESRVTISGTVSNPDGTGLVRRVLLLDRNRQPIAETRSNTAGQASFAVNGTARDIFAVLACGRDGECDAISCPLNGEEA